ncbi:MAG: Ig-like domain-containing protein [Chloroflexota bacterium]
MFIRIISLLISLSLLAGCNLGEPGSITPMPTPDIPQIEILAPQNNQQVVVGTEFDFDIVARDSNPGIANVELYIDEVLINDASPIESSSVDVFRTSMNWLASGIGLHIVEVIAYRPDGQQSDPAQITIEVVPRDE